MYRRHVVASTCSAVIMFFVSLCELFALMCDKIYICIAMFPHKSLRNLTDCCVNACSFVVLCSRLYFGFLIRDSSPSLFGGPCHRACLQCSGICFANWNCIPFALVNLFAMSLSGESSERRVSFVTLLRSETLLNSCFFVVAVDAAA